MNIEQTFISGLYVVTPKVFGDHRGWFSETYSSKVFKDAGIDINFVQDNHSFSAQKGTLRGLHLQSNPKSQTKLLRCTKGEILDVAVDLRSDSPTYKKWFSVVLSAENHKQLLIPKGFAHGFVTLSSDVEVQYKVDEFYSPEHDRSVLWNDPDIGVDWGVADPILSDKDKTAPRLADVDFVF